MLPLFIFLAASLPHTGQLTDEMEPGGATDASLFECKKPVVVVDDNRFFLVSRIMCVRYLPGFLSVM